MIRIAGANLSACANASGMTRPAISPKILQSVRDEKIEVDKDSVIQFMTTRLIFAIRRSPQ
jgi:hypothetical protein